MLNVTEIFKSHQCEGVNTGKLAVFVRLAGCIPPYCDYCDTKYSWNGCGGYADMSVYDVYDEVYKLTKKESCLIVITGGEPFKQKEVYKLTRVLLQNPAYTVQFETSGKGRIDVNGLSDEVQFVVSPKRYNGKFVVDKLSIELLADLYDRAFFKFVISNEQDAKASLKFTKEYKIAKRRVSFMPLGATRIEQQNNMQKVIELALKYNVNFSARLHTLIWDTKRRV